MEGAAPADALRGSVQLARDAERLGLERFWAAEHHGSPGFAGSAPSILAAAALAATCRLRVGSGGVLLPRHEPATVAEQFRVLAALFPGRVDLGIGRAGGPAGSSPEQLVALFTSLGLAEDPGVMPTCTEPPQIWLLGAGGSPAALAGQLGASYCFAHFLGSVAGVEAMASPREHVRARSRGPVPRAALAVRVIAADTAARASELAAGLLLWRSRKDLGQDRPFPALDTTARHRWTDAECTRAALHRRSLIAGTAEQVQVRLADLAVVHGVDELVVNTPTHDLADRLRSHQLLTEVVAATPGEQHRGPVRNARSPR